MKPSKKRSVSTSKRSELRSVWEIQLDMEKQQRAEQLEYAQYQAEQALLLVSEKLGKLLGICRSLLGVRPATEAESCERPTWDEIEMRRAAGMLTRRERAHLYELDREMERADNWARIRAQEAAFAKAVQVGGFSDGTIKEMDRLYGVAETAKSAAPEPDVSRPPRKRTKRSVCEHESHRTSSFLINKRLWCRYCDRPYRSPRLRRRAWRKASGKS